MKSLPCHKGRWLLVQPKDGGIQDQTGIKISEKNQTKTKNEPKKGKDSKQQYIDIKKEKREINNIQYPEEVLITR